MVSTPVNAPSSPKRAATCVAGVLSAAASASADCTIRNTLRHLLAPIALRNNSFAARPATIGEQLNGQSGWGVWFGQGSSVTFLGTFYRTHGRFSPHH